jgi:redox-sensitive bicupin YhaK (pirin superfamily)
MRSVKDIHDSLYAPIDDLETYRPMPTRSIDHIDPFLFLNHHGPQTYSPGNRGLPFGPHPHRGFETLTYILKGDIVHQDSGGHKSKIEAGGVQWMTAGSGLIHSEISSEDFKSKGGEVEILQLWMNLPAKFKMTDPDYKGLTKDEVKHLDEDDGKVRVNLISGDWKGTQGPIDSLTNLMLTSIEIKSGGKFQLDVPKENNILFYVAHGTVKVNGKEATEHNLVEFANDDAALEVEATEDAILIFGHGKPFEEPIVAQGPFVMNSHQEIRQAMEDYQAGKMGVWEG